MKIKTRTVITSPRVAPVAKDVERADLVSRIRSLEQLIKINMRRLRGAVLRNDERKVFVLSGLLADHRAQLHNMIAELNRRLSEAPKPIGETTPTLARSRTKIKRKVYKTWSEK